MKQAVLTAVFALLCWCAQAQVELDVTPNPLERAVEFDLSSLHGDETFRVWVKNSSNRMASLRWEIAVDEAPANWRFSVCDQNTCYFTTNTTNVDLYDNVPNAPVLVPPGDSAKLELNVFPIGTAGTANVRINLYDMANPRSPLNTANFNVTIEGITELTELDKGRLRVYPNPVSDYLTITKNSFVKQLWVANILGKRVKTFDTAYTSRYDMSDLPDGIYLVSMVDASRKVIKTVRINKRSIRP